MKLAEIHDLAWRFVPGAAADGRLYNSGARSWWPAHEIGHFLVATAEECNTFMFGIESGTCVDFRVQRSPWIRYVVSREVAAMSISQRLLRRSGHVDLADLEVEYTDEDTLYCADESWCRQIVHRLLRRNHVCRLPATQEGLARLLTRKAREVGTPYYKTRRDAATGRRVQKGS